MSISCMAQTETVVCETKVLLFVARRPSSTEYRTNEYTRDIHFPFCGKVNDHEY